MRLAVCIWKHMSLGHSAPIFAGSLGKFLACKGWPGTLPTVSPNDIYDDTKYLQKRAEFLKKQACGCLSDELPGPHPAFRSDLPVASLSHVSSHQGECINLPWEHI